jgi:hypothetical protein
MFYKNQKYTRFDNPIGRILPHHQRDSIGIGGGGVGKGGDRQQFSRKYSRKALLVQL